MVPHRSRAPFAAAALCALALPTPASDLTIDGGTQAAVPYGASFLIELSGKPGAPALVFADVTPGPTNVLGEPVPLGLTPALFLLLVQPIPPSGTLAIQYPVPGVPAYAGKTVYLAGVVVDDADPNDLDFSNGVRLDVVPPVGAGASQATLVGRAVVLDGSGAGDADAMIPPSTAVHWTIRDAPAGSTASIDFATSLLASFAPDVPGDYVLRLTASSGGAVVAAETVVHAYEIVPTFDFDGQWVSGGGFPLGGTVDGPAVAGFTVNGAPTALSGGVFGPKIELFPPGATFYPVTFEIVHPDGTVARERITVGSGASLPLSGGSSNALVAHLRQPALNQIAQAAEGLLANLDIASIIASIPPTQVANTSGPFGITLFSATVDFTGLTFSPNVDVQLTPHANGVLGLVRLFNLKATFDVSGEIVEVDYNLSGDITSNPKDISGLLQLGATPGGQLDANLVNVNVVRNQFAFNLNGFFGSVAELFIIEDWVRDQVESAVESAVATELAPAIETILNDLTLAGNLFPLLEIDVDVGAEVAGVQTSTGGPTILLDASATVGVAEPGSPPVTRFRSTPTATPAFGATTPGGAGYGVGLGAADDFFNQVLAASTAAGLLDGDLTSLLDAQGTGQALTTDGLAALFPGAGFELFPTGTTIELRTHGTFPPVLRTTPGGPTLAELALADLEIAFQVPVPGGTLTPLRLALDGTADVSLGIGLDGTIAATLGSSDVDVQVLQGFPGSDLTVLGTGVDFLVGFLLPTLTNTLGSIPVPALEAQGLALQPSEVGLAGGSAQYVTFWGAFVFVP